MACGVISITSANTTPVAPGHDQRVPGRASRARPTHSSAITTALQARHRPGAWTMVTSSASIGSRPVQVW